MPAYVFGEKKNYSVAAIRELDSIRQQQAIHAARAYAGGAYDTLDDMHAGLQKAMDQDEIDLDHYEIRREGDDEASHEMWVVATDNGVVFKMGEEDPTSVHCSQSNFWSVDDEDAEAIALAEALNEVVPF